MKLELKSPNHPMRSNLLSHEWALGQTNGQSNLKCLVTLPICLMGRWANNLKHNKSKENDGQVKLLSCLKYGRD